MSGLKTRRQQLVDERIKQRTDPVLDLWLQGATYDAIGKRHGISRGAVAGLIHRHRKFLTSGKRR